MPSSDIAAGLVGPLRTTRAPCLDVRFAVPLRGVAVDVRTGCAHYRSPRDVTALRFACCDAYYPCRACHDATVGHEAEVWPRARFDEPAVLCGVCRTSVSARAYLEGGHACPACGAAFNPGCAAHRDRYFERDGSGPAAP